MKKTAVVLAGLVIFTLSAIPVSAKDPDLVERIDKILSQGPAHDNYHVAAWQVNKWIIEKKSDYQVVDVRIPPEDGAWGKPEYGRIPESMYIPYNELFRPENLKKLPNDKKIVLVGHMNVYENFLVVPLRLLGYDAYIMLLGMSGWQKDYPAAEHITSLLHDAQTQGFPLAKEAEGIMLHQKHKKHKR